MTDREFVESVIKIVDCTIGGYDWCEDVASQVEDLVKEYKEQRGEV